MQFSVWKKSIPLLLAAFLVLAGILPALAAAGASPQSGASSGTVKLASSSSHLNVRSGPGTRYSTLGSLRHGAAVTITGEQSGWYSIAFDGRTGYVKASYITRNPQSADTSAAFTGRIKLASSSGRLNVRKGPGTGYATLGQLANGAKVSVTAAQGGWYAIAYNGSTGYVSSAYVVKDGAATPTATNAPSQPGKSGRVTASSLNVRKGPGTGYARIGSLRLGDTVTFYEQEQGFYRILYQGAVGYVSAQYIKPIIQHSDLKGLVIGIDAGHQAKANYDKEPVAPGSSEKKAKVSSGTQGVSTRTPEHEVNLKVALLLRDYLEDAGATVIMSRTSADVNISNVQRAQKMNEAKCDLVLRIHCNGSTNASVTGAFMLVPSGKSTTAIAAESKAAASTILKAFLARTGAKDLGITPRDDLSGFNWSTVPVCLIEMGHQTNVQEDKKLASHDYQQKCARGLYEGICDWYLNG